MFRCIVVTTTLALVSFFVAVSAEAAPERFSYAGSVVSVTDPTGILSPAIQTGTLFSGEYEIDPVLGDTTFVPGNGGTLYFNSAGNKLGGNRLNIAGEMFVIAVAAVQAGTTRSMSRLASSTFGPSAASPRRPDCRPSTSG